MIVRHYIACETCGHAHTLRLQVGHTSYQEHTFHCVDCGERIVIGMHCYPETASVKIKEIENATLGKDEGTIVNLSPEFPISPEDVHRDLAFPSLVHVRSIMMAQEALGVKQQSFTNVEDARRHAMNAPSFPEMWAVVKKGWSLTSSGREDLATQQWKKYPISTYKEPLQFNYVLFDFCRRFLMPGRHSLFEDASDFIARTAKQNQIEFHRFKHYYKTNIEAENHARYFSVFSEYFNCFTDFSQTLVFAQHGVIVPDTFEASSSAFDKTKLFYGNAFEALTSNISVIACINNIHNGRSFDQFEKMDLSKYLRINKANRANPFKDTAELASISACLDSALRNASHHGAATLINRGKTIQYRSGGTGAYRTMSYKEYIDKCNEIMLASCVLMLLELVIGF